MVDQRARTNPITRPTPEPLIINELRVNSTIYGYLLATRVQARKASNGKIFLDLRLRDQRGSEIIARYFDPPPSEARMPQEGKIVLLEGTVENFQGQTQIRLARAMLDESLAINLFVLGTRRPIAELEAAFQQLMSKVDHSGLRELLQQCFTLEVRD